MKHLIPMVLFLLPACRTQSDEAREIVQPPPDPVEAAAVLDFSDFHEKPMTVEEFVKVCQEVSGFNFTYAETTKEAMSTTTLRLVGSSRIPSPEFGDFLDKELQRCGFTCERVGPEGVRVFLIKPRAM